RHQEPEEQLHRDGDDGVDERDANGVPEDARVLVTGEQLDVVVESDPAGLSADRLVLEAQDDAGNERVGDEGDEDEDEREREGVAELPLGAQPGTLPGGRSRIWCGDRLRYRFATELCPPHRRCPPARLPTRVELNVSCRQYTGEQLPVKFLRTARVATDRTSGDTAAQSNDPHGGRRESWRHNHERRATGATCSTSTYPTRRSCRRWRRYSPPGRRTGSGRSHPRSA